MQQDCNAHVRRCHLCQVYAMSQKVPLKELYTITVPWPFATWGIDIIGKISLKASNGHQYNLVAIDYFTKWVEAESYAELDAKAIARFLKKNIICRFGVPHEIVSENGTHFEGGQRGNGRVWNLETKVFSLSPSDQWGSGSSQQEFERHHQQNDQRRPGLGQQAALRTMGLSHY